MDENASLWTAIRTIEQMKTELAQLRAIIKQQHKVLEEISDSDPDECPGRLRDIANEGLRGWEDDN